MYYYTDSWNQLAIKCCCWFQQLYFMWTFMLEDQLLPQHCILSIMWTFMLEDQLLPQHCILSIMWTFMLEDQLLPQHCILSIMWTFMLEDQLLPQHCILSIMNIRQDWLVTELALLYNFPVSFCNFISWYFKPFRWPLSSSVLSQWNDTCFHQGRLHFVFLQKGYGGHNDNTKLWWKSSQFIHHS